MELAFRNVDYADSIGMMHLDTSSDPFQLITYLSSPPCLDVCSRGVWCLERATLAT